MFGESPKYVFDEFSKGVEIEFSPFLILIKLDFSFAVGQKFKLVCIQKNPLLRGIIKRRTAFSNGFA